MDTYKYEKLRNVAVLGHGGAGKTTLVEAIAFTTGLTTRQGKIEEGNTISDYDREEAKRLCSVSTSVVPVIWEDIKINFLDTPGSFDFVGEVEEAVSACDAAVIVVSARKGIEVGTEKAWERVTLIPWRSTKKASSSLHFAWRKVTGSPSTNRSKCPKVRKRMRFF